MSPFASDSTFTSPYSHNVVGGSASTQIKKLLDDLVHTPSRHPQQKLFASTIMDSMILVDVSIGSMPEESSRLEGKVVLQLVVNEDMLNLANTVHGGCLAYFVDFCSSLALVALDVHQSNDYTLSVSQALNIVFHSPAAFGETIRIVNMSVSSGGRSATGRTEIWNENHKRIVASGTHIKMLPSSPKLKL
ncbi:HotDog domain-containing protein [Lentinula boryana]|uniref:HotDog domain-containing protein n=1 Tax=Lentinula boryana TaxID=40481 RepID=A0ABQ8QSB7_9AGAR|nr:HotDog domain-containing protein [Lentinula boryana]